ncbi:MAG: hypothetical protein WCO28_10635 [Bacteroidota bacterium]|jgi:uncharacterized Zn finger protein (UPF0148 family)
MSTCGYTCPQCEGKGFMADGSVCDWCGTEVKSEKEKVESDDIKLENGNEENVSID